MIDYVEYSPIQRWMFFPESVWRINNAHLCCWCDICTMETIEELEKWIDENRAYHDYETGVYIEWGGK